MQGFRLGWVEACVRYAGRFGAREKVVFQQLFGVSEASASRDQEAFQRRFEHLHQHEVFIKHSDGRLVGGRLTLIDDVELVADIQFPSMPSIDRWLEDMFGRSRFEQTVLLRSDPHQHILRVVIQGIEDRRVLSIAYHSRSGNSIRKISPHVIVKVVGRYHVRAYDHAKNDYRDFVLARILSATHSQSEREGYIDGALDKDWQCHVDIMVQAKSAETGHLSRGIRLDFGLDESGQKRFRVRKALAPYLVDDVRDGFSQPVEVLKA